MSTSQDPVKASQISVYMLGTWRIERATDGTGDATVRPLRLPTRKVEVLLAYLALHPIAHSREKLAALLWGDSPDELARGSLRKALTLLRSHLGGDLLLADRETVQLNPAFPLWVDVHAFKAQAEVLLAMPVPDAASFGTMDVELYRGELLADFYDDWIIPVRDHLRDLFLSALLRLVKVAEVQPDYERAIDLAGLLLRHDPANEDGHRSLMRAYAATGRRAAALEQFARCKRSLRKELDVDPNPATVVLHERIKREQAIVPIPTLLTNLPTPLTTFVGRKRLLAEIRAVLRNERLLTLTGSGGSGKTRIAIQVASEASGEYPDGVWWLDLSALTDDTLAPAALAKTFGLQEVPGLATTALLANYLRSRRLLLVLDNCEHLIMACAQMVGALLTACPRLTILATSREPIGIGGEAVWQVPPMEVPNQQAPDSPTALLEIESARLFWERARAVSPHFAITAHSAPSVISICRELDGLPLAIELAAARVTVLSPAQIVERLNDRFGLLTGGGRLAGPRQQTLRATIDWSYELLDEAERAMLRRLSVFAGGFTLEAAEAIWRDTASQPSALELLSHLIDKSLVSLEGERTALDAPPRYRLLETICQYAAERLAEAGETAPARRRHLAFYCALAEQSESAWYGPRQVAVANMLDHEMDNYRAALAYSLAQDPVMALRTAAALGFFSSRRAAPSEGRFWLESAIARVEALPAALEDTTTQAAHARAYGWLGQTAMASGDNSSADRYFARGAELAQATGDHRARAMAIGMLGFIEMLSGDMEAAGPHLQEAVDIERAQDDRPVLPMALGTLARYWVTIGKQDEGRACAEEAIALAAETGNRWFSGMARQNLALIAMQQGAYDEASRHLEASLAILTEMGDRHFANVATSALADIARLSGDRERARLLYRQVMLTWRDFANPGAIARCLECLAFLATGDECTEASFSTCCYAASLLGAAAALRQRYAAPMAVYEADEYHTRRDALQARLGDQAFAAEWTSAQAFTIDQAIALAQRDF